MSRKATASQKLGTNKSKQMSLSSFLGCSQNKKGNIFFFANLVICLKK